MNNQQTRQWTTWLTWTIFGVLFALTALFRWYQPLTHHALLQFDVFDWARRSREWLMLGQMHDATSLWVFPVWNAVVAKVTGFDLFNIYLYSGALLTTLNIFLLYGIGVHLWRQPLLRLSPVLFYAFNTQLLSRSVNYLPETMTFTFGLALVLLYLRLLKTRQPGWWIPIGILNYFYYHLHQSGINFLFFSGVVFVVYATAFVRLSWKVKIGGLALLAVIGGGLLYMNHPLWNQILFFLRGSKNADVAFQGTPIPLTNFFVDFPAAFYTMAIIGAGSIVLLMFRKRSAEEKAMWGILLLIALFYYCFLYLFPVLRIYSLVPWRFYTWFSLYALLIASRGVAVLYHAMVERLHHAWTFVVLVGLMVFNISHVGLLRDNMFTADAATLHSMEQAPIPNGSFVYTTNANFLQARYAFVGRDLAPQEAGTDLFRAASSRAAYTFVTTVSQGKDAYVLVSLYQLRQRPSSIDYWRNSALYDMDLALFDNAKYFESIYRDNNIVVFHALPTSLPTSNAL